jgi:CRISPR system Cascade subunit CasA
MNTSIEPWIPIVWADGQPGMVSLCEVFERGEDIRDLAVRPHERIAVMRLLICITQAALDGPTAGDDWKTCRPKIAPAALAYLKRWHKTFELLGDGPRFLQVEGLKKPTDMDDDEEGNSVSKLDLALATGNNTTLFDNGGGSDRGFGSPQVALTLLAFQCFSPCGTIGVALWNGTPTLGWSSYPKVKPGQSKHAPCLAGNMLHSYLRGRTLVESLYRNLMTKEAITRFCGHDAWGKPVWEQIPSKPTDKTAIRNATQTYLGRLASLSRSIRLEDDCQSMMLANGLEYPGYPEWRETSATIVTRSIKKQPTRVTLPASIDKGTWRELHALAVIGVDKNTNGGPAALQNISEETAFDMWVGGLVAEGNGKLVDTTESVFHVPAAMLGETSQRVYEQGVRWAESAAFRLSRAACTYHRELGDKLDRAELRDRRQQIQNKATAQFWTDIEQAVPQLLDVAANPEQLGVKNEWHKTGWGKAVWAAIRAAYEHACPHSTPRQMRAYALGLNTLHFTPTESSNTAANDKETVS